MHHREGSKKKYLEESLNEECVEGLSSIKSHRFWTKDEVYVVQIKLYNEYVRDFKEVMGKKTILMLIEWGKHNVLLLSNNRFFISTSLWTDCDTTGSLYLKWKCCNIILK